jgi:hypothetical protein
VQADANISRMTPISASWLRRRHVAHEARREGPIAMPAAR